MSHGPSLARMDTTPVGRKTHHEPHKTGSFGRLPGCRRDRRKLLESHTGMAWWREGWQPGRWFLPKKHWAQLQSPTPTALSL